MIRVSLSFLRDVMPPNTGLVRHHPCQRRPDFLMDLMFDCYQRESVSFPLSTTMAIGGRGGSSGPCEEIPAINPRLLTLTGSLPPHLLAPDSGKRCYRRSNAIHQGLSLATRARAPLAAFFSLFKCLSLSLFSLSRVPSSRSQWSSSSRFRDEEKRKLTHAPTEGIYFG